MFLIPQSRAFVTLSLIIITLVSGYSVLLIDSWLLCASLAFFTALIFQGLLWFVFGFGRFSPFCFFLPFIYVAGYFTFNSLVEARVEAQLPSELESKDLRVSGVVLSSEKTSDKYQRFMFQVESLSVLGNEPKSEFSGPIRLSWRNERLTKPGDKLVLVARLKRPRGFVNPAGFDYQRWLLSKNIFATGYVKFPLKTDSYVKELHARQPIKIISQGLAENRQVLASQLEYKLKGLSQAGVIKALLIGDKSDISQSQWALFQSTGTIHLMAISGLHVGMVCAMVLIVFRLFKKPICFIVGLRCYLIVSFASCCFVAFLYAYLAGFSVPTQRAFFCVVLLGGLVLVGRRTNMLQVLAMIALSVALINPFSMLSPGFILSFSAVACLIVSFGKRCGSRSKLYLFVKAQFILFVSLLPFMFLLGLPVSIFSPVANGFAIPLMSLGILPSLFIGLLLMPVSESLSSLVFQFSNMLLELCLSSLDLLAFAPFHLSYISAYSSALCIFAAVLFLLPSAMGMRRYGCLLLIAFFITQLYSPNKNGVELSVLDVGQGLSVVLDDGENALIYDVGAKFSESFSIANRVLLPFMHARGGREQIQVLISHADNDHAGDLSALMPELSTLSLHSPSLASGEPEKLINLGLDSATACEPGLQLVPIKGVTGEVLWPRNDLPARRVIGFKSNNRSCVVHLNIQGVSILLMGDIEKEVEHYLLALAALPQNIDLLLAPHHGSATSSSSALLRRLNPRHVIVSAGYKNRYQHPAEAVVERYQAQETVIWNTAYHGALTVKLEDGELKLEAERCDRARAWYLDEGYCRN